MTQQGWIATSSSKLALALALEALDSTHSARRSGASLEVERVVSRVSKQVSRTYSRSSTSSSR